MSKVQKSFTGAHVQGRKFQEFEKKNVLLVIMPCSETLYLRIIFLYQVVQNTSHLIDFCKLFLELKLQYPGKRLSQI